MRVSLTLCVLVAGFAFSEALYSKGGAVQVLDSSNLKSSLQKGAWMVEFYAPWCGHCKNLKPEWDKAAQALKNIVNVGAVDCDAHKEIAGEYGVQGFPTIKFMYSDGGKIKTVDYQGERTAKAIVNFAMDKAKSLALKRIGEKPSKSSSSSSSSAGGRASEFYGADSAVINLGDNDFDAVLSDKGGWFVEFYAPWCGHCKNLKPEYIAAAEKLKGKIKFAAINCDEEKSLCGKYDIGGFPTIKFFGVNKQNPIEYQGARDADGMVEFGLAQWAKNAPAPEVRELTSPAVWEEHCVGGAAPKMVCFIAFLPNILDSKADGRRDYIKTLKKAAEHHKVKVDYAYFWAEGGAQPELEANVEVGGFGYPAVVALSPKQKAYKLLKGPLDLTHMKEFIGGIRALDRIRGDLANISTVTPWDGKDAVVEEEEEFDLSDIMGEDL